jgi:hypothetical protein
MEQNDTDALRELVDKLKSQIEEQQEMIEALKTQLNIFTLPEGKKNGQE